MQTQLQNQHSLDIRMVDVLLELDPEELDLYLPHLLAQLVKLPQKD